jgi:hypothetical protein
MNNRERYYKVIDDFINHPNSKILLLKGKWGIGKTFFWKDYLNNKLNTLDFRAYSYISLFGLDNINTLKGEIFGNAVVLNKDWNSVNKVSILNKLGSYANRIPFIKKLKILNKARSINKISPVIKLIPYIKNYQGIITHFENLYIKNFLICFDDIERKSKGLALSTFLGFCSQLKEENSCKIVIIMNEDEIDKNEDDCKELLKYREKVIDQELLFQPSLSDNYSIIFNDKKYDDVSNLIEKLNIVNLRILQKIRWNLDFFEKYINDLEPSVKTYFNRQIASLSFFILSSDVSSEFNKIATDVIDYSKKESMERKTSFLNRYGYYFEPNDIIFINYIRDMHLDEDGLRDYLMEVNEKEKLSKIRAKIEKLWDYYSANFLLSPQEFLANFTNLLDTDLQYLSLRDLESILNALKKLDSNYEVDKYWEKYIELNINQSNLENLASLKTKVSNPELISKIESKYTQKISSQSIKEIIYHITEKNSWNHNHILRLIQAEEKEYYDWFISETDSNILYSLRSFLQTFSPSSQNEEFQKIGLKIVKVLNEIAKIDKLKEIRVREFFDIKENV